MKKRVKCSTRDLHTVKILSIQTDKDVYLWDYILIYSFQDSPIMQQYVQTGNESHPQSIRKIDHD